MTEEKIADEIFDKAVDLRKTCIENDIPLIIGMVIREEELTILMPCDTENANMLLERMKELNIKNAEFWKERKASEEKLEKVSNE